MVQMTSKQRILNTFAHKETDRIPWAPLVDSYYTEYLKNIGMDMNVVQTLRCIGADIIERHIPACRVSYKGNIKYYTRRKNGDMIYCFETPVGSIQKKTRYMGNTENIIKYYIENKEDVKILQYIEEHKEFLPDYDFLIKEQKLIGDDGIATVTANSTPLANLYEFYMGLEGFIYGLYDYTDELEALMEIMHENNKKEHRILAQSPSESVFMYEDTSTTTISRELYIKYCKKQLDDYAAIVHEEGKFYFVHMCGKLKGFIDLIADNLMDGIDSLCPPTTGDLWAHEALSAWKGKIVIGGLEPPRLQMSSVSEVEEYAIDVLRNAVPCGNFILSTGDATAYGTPLENLIAITGIVKKYGKHNEIL